MSDAILLTVDDGLARLTLNRPQRLNAFNIDLAHAWAEKTVEATSRTDVGAILLDAAGPAFCAGGDVTDMASKMGSGSDIDRLAGVINTGIRALTESAVPVVAAAHGTTAGGGLGILMCSDYAVVGEDSRIGSLYANIGLTPDLSVSAQLARAVGERRALQLVLQDRLLSASEALDWGLVAEVVAPDAVKTRAEEIARGWLAGAYGAYGQAKRLIRSQPSRSFADQLAEEARSIGAAFDTPDAQARIAAFAAASARRAAKETS
ncbi:enoyl-CoA hydratase/isomerase family protein [Microbacterium thalassium]|uniref:2-(1,2-epoxy-1,2-dihydrophenyl)acetyl-CoA isomerase n=1 Tax=Microbacterium thalassium TaxID=362649 RepID=A0A7X0FNI6_9MICO|nr:enoyl-CoA hydratase/isomerase family protein [Microbacterium thalassium]MBB6390773.1 2-(1,2-epoxy-1,2-dihydrophenyl)acetyl-CoA isomerase [Microbacterium thalassium]GLK25881.1 enoyl-CoA hydratase [Microbacterium thalassium]